MVTEDEKLLNWVSKHYPNLDDVVVLNARRYWVLGYKYVRLPLIMSLAEISGFDIEWSDPPSKKTYNRTIKKLRNHIMDNPDVILFALL